MTKKNTKKSPSKKAVTKKPAKKTAKKTSSSKPAKKMDDARTFEQRAMEGSLRSLVQLAENLEQRTERRTMETRLIWEHALAQILQVKERVGEIERKLDLEIRLTHEDRRRMNIEIENLKGRI